jgi:oligoribonuclease NrnB/cAMP/cGMP phosphodiesterase (DHH superfamily)
MNKCDKYNYVIYHRNCLDGFTSFIIADLSNKIDKNALILPDIPSAQHPPRNIEGKNILIMDVAYNEKVAKEIFVAANSVVFIDHHITNHSEIVQIKKNLDKNIQLIYDESECGASLTWKFFFGNKIMPQFLKYIKANDLGNWDKYKDTLNFITSLSVNFNFDLTEKNINNWKTLFDPEIVKKIIKKGKIYREYTQNEIEKNYKRYSMMAFPSEAVYEKYTDYFDKPGQYKVAVSSSSCPSVSQLGDYMLKHINCDFVMFVTHRLDTHDYVISFRSLLVDVGQIAKMFEGGGHTHASACSIQISEFQLNELFMRDSLPRQKR